MAYPFSEMTWNCGEKGMYILYVLISKDLHDTVMGEEWGMIGHWILFPHISACQKYVFVYMYTQTFIRSTHKKLLMVVSGERDEEKGGEGDTLHFVISLNLLTLCTHYC